ncbi:trans-2,3-enoyl-CoA reductase domain protein, partial [Opisthorchis viverrini]
GKALNDSRRLEDLCEGEEKRKLCLYLRDLGPQIGWRTVFLVEYTAPLVLYLTMWVLRQPQLHLSWITPITTHQGLRNLALACWCGHYVKRIAETLFVHRFSNATMPLRNLFKNATYYGGFGFFVSYFVNHPLYTLPHCFEIRSHCFGNFSYVHPFSFLSHAVYGCKQICFGLGLFLVSEYGNFCCHLVLRNLRPAGSTVRGLPKPEPGQFLTRMFNLVACPNYTYEVMAWLGFSIMTQSLPALMFTVVGFIQMAIWALKKRQAYIREFAEFPRSRRAIVPYLL